MDNLKNIELLIGGLFLASLCGSLYLRRDALIISAFRVLIIFIAYRGASAFKYWRGKSYAALIGYAAAVICDTLIFSHRSRTIPESLRNEVIRRFEQRTGQKYDSAIQDIDHKVPQSKGGTTTLENLRVIHRSANRSKGDTTPWWDLLGHLQGDSESPFDALRAQIFPGPKNNSD